MVQSGTGSVLLTGGTGYIGSIAADFLARGAAVPQVWACGSSELDVTDRRAVADALDELEPDVVFHLAAKADTDWCEDNFEEARKVNVQGSLNTVEEALRRGIRVVYFSSACLYPDNEKWYGEHDEMRASCRYTETKLLAERKLEPYGDRILTIRMRQPFSNHRHPRNLIQKLASYRSFIDEPNSMSHLEECIPVVWELCRDGETGPYNVTNRGWTTPLRIAGLIRRHWNGDLTVRQIGYQELLGRLKAHRVNSLVDCSRLAARGFELSPVEEAIVDCLKNPCSPGTYDWSRNLP